MHLIGNISGHKFNIDLSLTHLSHFDKLISVAPSSEVLTGLMMLWYNSYSSLPMVTHGGASFYHIFSQTHIRLTNFNKGAGNETAFNFHRRNAHIFPID
ncbi:MAG: hypothetical protein OXU27_07475, partial [Candidatus Poribacteria bacterium]|nr:hypothetical protein [Candidatus Poribacteria bacterium]